MKTVNRKRKPCNIHDLYPKDYCFDWKTFESDPENYVFTKEDIAYSNAIELEKFEQETPMTPYEKRALRRWVASGHSVMETPPSRYPCIHCCYPPPSFLDVYREDKQLDAATKGMSRAERKAYLRKYLGFEEEPEEERKEREEQKRLHEQTPEPVKKTIERLQRKIFYLFMFLGEQDLYTEATEYLEEHMDEPTPFEDVW
ncbi:MAG: hypothetical protein J6D36_00905 [Erysipelotrichaceae bacterium]|nr:hypothetical protein [Erysipelotrichaceae bacterium]